MKSKRIIHQLYLLIIVLFLFALFNLAAIYSAIDRTTADGRIINFVGIVRGKSQRIIKLELAQVNADQHIREVKQIITGLIDGSQTLKLSPPQNSDFQAKMVIIEQQWQQLREHIQRFREQSISPDRLIEESEIFWNLTNTTVFTAEKLAKQNINYSKNVAIFVFMANCILLVIIGRIVRKIVLKLQHSVRLLVSSSSQIAMTLEEQEQTTKQQSASVHQTTTTMNELGASSHQSAEQAEVAAHATQQALTLANGGMQTVEQSLAETNNLNEKVNAIAEQILLLSEQTAEIGSISQLVLDLAERTNMLALNAAIEAVRAGEQGQGFSVVATEIRKLADLSKQSVQKINGLVRDSQYAINSTVMVADEGTKTVDSNVKIARKTADVFFGVAKAVNNVVLSNQQISLNIKQQATAIQQIVHTMNAINQSVRESAQAIGQTRLGTQQLNKATQFLKEMI